MIYKRSKSIDIFTKTGPDFINSLDPENFQLALKPAVLQITVGEAPLLTTKSNVCACNITGLRAGKILICIRVSRLREIQRFPFEDLKQK